MLWLSLYLPQLPLEVYTRAHAGSVPLAVYETREQRRWVRNCNSAARARGIKAGMGLNAALSICHELRARGRDTGAEHQALEGIAQWAGQFTPLISLRPPRAVLLEIEGSLKLFGGVEALRSSVAAGLRALGYQARTAVAPTPLGAWLLCRAGRESLIQSRDELARQLSDLPVEALDGHAVDIPALRGMGLRRIGECLRLPRQGLARRLGPALLQNLDRALGHCPDPRTPYEPPVRFEHHLHLPREAGDAENLLFAAHRLLLELAGFLRARGQGALGFELLLEYSKRPRGSLGLNLVHPSRDAAHMLSLLRERLAHEALPDTVQAIGLRTRALSALAHCDGDLFNAGTAEETQWPQLLERLYSRLGTEAVQGLRLHADHRPEYAWRYCKPGECAKTGAAPPRPLWLLETPRPLKGLDAVRRLLAGPERIESGWWDERIVLRDYFVAEGPNRERLWIFRERREPHQWFLHGVFA